MSFGALVLGSLAACYANGIRRFLSKGVAFSIGQFGTAYAQTRLASGLPDTRENACAGQLGKLG